MTSCGVLVEFCIGPEFQHPGTGFFDFELSGALQLPWSRQRPCRPARGLTNARQCLRSFRTPVETLGQKPFTVAELKRTI
jgi:hypothetical protein